MSLNTESQNSMHACVRIMGGLGNRLFQIAFLLGFCEKYSYTPYITWHTYLPSSHDTVDWSYFMRGIKQAKTTVPGHSFYDLEPHDKCGVYRDMSALAGYANFIFEGYFQTEKYFKHIAPRIRDQFGCPDPAALRTRYPELDTAAFLHVRRGDYVNSPHHYIDLESYYGRALKRFGPDTTCLVVSNDTEFCRTIPWLQNVKHRIVENENELDTLWLMSMCGRGGICANSTFSWWGGWLNDRPGRTVVFPSRMFPHDLIRTDNLVPASFVVEAV